MNKHTPTPWAIGTYGEVCQDKGEFYGLRDRVEVTGFLLTESAGNPEAAANTAHIVRCVNSHEALVAQMINALELIELLRANSSDRVVVENTQLAPMYAALAAAGATQ